MSANGLTKHNFYPGITGSKTKVKAKYTRFSNVICLTCEFELG